MVCHRARRPGQRGDKLQPGGGSPGQGAASRQSGLGRLNDADFATTATKSVSDPGLGRRGLNKNNPATALDVNGTVTANAFAGDGAALTGLDAGTLSSGTVPTDVSAAM